MRARNWKSNGNGNGNGDQNTSPSEAEDDDSLIDVPLPLGLAEWETNVKEGARPYRRVRFDNERWKRHRSIGRYWRHIATMPSSRVVRGLLAPCSFTSLIAYAAYVFQPVEPLGLTSTLPFELTSPLLGLLLVFRTNEAMARWLRAHDAWARVVSRNLEARDVIATHVEDDEMRECAGRHLLAHASALAARYRTNGERAVHDDEWANVLMPEEREAMESARENRPAHALRVVRSVMSASDAPMHAQARIADCIATLTDACTECDQLTSTPIPLSYTRHTSRFLLLWLSLLPFPLALSLGIAAVPATFFIAILLLGVEEIGVQIEEPLSVADIEGFVAELHKESAEADAQRERVNELIMRKMKTSQAAIK